MSLSPPAVPFAAAATAVCDSPQPLNALSRLLSHPFGNAAESLRRLTVLTRLLRASPQLRLLQKQRNDAGAAGGGASPGDESQLSMAVATALSRDHGEGPAEGPLEASVVLAYDFLELLQGGRQPDSLRKESNSLLHSFLVQYGVQDLLSAHLTVLAKHATSGGAQPADADAADALVAPLRLLRRFLTLEGGGHVGTQVVPPHRACTMPTVGSVKWWIKSRTMEGVGTKSASKTSR